VRERGAIDAVLAQPAPADDPADRGELSRAGGEKPLTASVQMELWRTAVAGTAS
jgi:hypothetical protein